MFIFRYVNNKQITAQKVFCTDFYSRVAKLWKTNEWAQRTSEFTKVLQRVNKNPYGALYTDLFRISFTTVQCVQSFLRIKYVYFFIDLELAICNSEYLTKLYLSLVLLLPEWNTVKMEKKIAAKPEMLSSYHGRKMRVSQISSVPSCLTKLFANVKYLTCCSVVLGFQGRSLLFFLRYICCEENSFFIMLMLQKNLRSQIRILSSFRHKNTKLRPWANK